MTFAQRLRQLRELRYGTQARLAEAAGVDQKQISRYETGAEPGLTNARKLAVALGVSLDELAGDEPSRDDDWTMVRVTVDDSGTEDMRITRTTVEQTTTGTAFRCADGWVVVARTRDDALRLANQVQR